MSFRKRNVVLSAAPPGRLPLRPGPEAAAAAASSSPPPPAPSSTASTTRTTTATPAGNALQPPAWPVTSRMHLPSDQQTTLAPVKARLRRALDRAKEERQKGQTQTQTQTQPPLGPGARPSPRDGRPITSTGTPSLDPLLAGYGGLLLGHSLLVEEQGTTDFAGVVLRAYAAEGLVQGHHVHVLGFGPAWRAELPGVREGSSSNPIAGTTTTDDKMKIAWRYEALARRGPPSSSSTPPTGPGTPPTPPFCHPFDLTRRLAPADCKGTLHATPLPDPLRLTPTSTTTSTSSSVDDALLAFLHGIRTALANTPPHALHRVVLPNFLAPALYGLDGWSFPRVLHALHALRALLRAHPRRLTAVLALPTTLYERGPGGHSGGQHYVAALERLCDNVVELVPLPPGPPAAKTAPTTSSSSSLSSPPKNQGWVRVHKVQVYSELGGLGASPQGRALRENLCFSVSATRGLEIAPYSLPPVEDEGGGGGGGSSGSAPAKSQDAMAF